MKVSIPINHAEERHRIQQDKLFEITAVNRYEWEENHAEA
jgi:hypothetical protein